MFVVLGLLLLIIIIVLILIFGGADKRKERKQELKEEEKRQKEEKAELKRRNKEAKRESRKYVDIFDQDDEDVQRGQTGEAKDFAESDDMMKTSEIDKILGSEPEDSMTNMFTNEEPEKDISELFNSESKDDSSLWDESDSLWRGNKEAEAELEKEKQLREELAAAEEAERLEKEKAEKEKAEKEKTEKETRQQEANSRTTVAQKIQKPIPQNGTCSGMRSFGRSASTHYWSLRAIRNLQELYHPKSQQPT